MSLNLTNLKLDGFVFSKSNDKLKITKGVGGADVELESVNSMISSLYDSETAPTLNGTNLQLTTKGGTTHNVDLSSIATDLKLQSAEITVADGSGTITAGKNIMKCTLSDSSTVEVDITSLLDNVNLNAVEKDITPYQLKFILNDSSYSTINIKTFFDPLITGNPAFNGRNLEFHKVGAPKTTIDIQTQPLDIKGLKLQSSGAQTVVCDASGLLTIDCNGEAYLVTEYNLLYNISSITINNGGISGTQVVVYITASGADRTISKTISGAKTNLSSDLSITSGSNALLTIGVTPSGSVYVCASVFS